MRWRAQQELTGLDRTFRQSKWRQEWLGLGLGLRLGSGECTIKDKYPSIFVRQMGAFMFIIVEIFFATRTVLKNWGIYTFH